MRQTHRLSGVALATAAATLFLTGCASEASAPGKTADNNAVMIKRYGANSCKGQAECKTAMNACKGQNSCKGKGFVSLTEQACVDRLGRV